MNADVEYLSTEDLLELARRLLGDSVPVRDIGLLGAAAARPQASAFGEDAYPDIWTKAAALLHSVVNNHPLVDGNKRLGWLATAVFLELNDASVSTASNETVYDLVMTVASTDHTVEDIADVLRRTNEADQLTAEAQRLGLYDC
ncbi:type II toxin-antitoxin system death-on-curing family toxin [Candidatus Poriferisodalis sp.]|uniref:type II toxin-antitoxin system death-on-curing family toxin n=1 Tax=Candidatus Poriferisodalis sp. TaxID=3101277 RepID=UPI003B595C88